MPCKIRTSGLFDESSLGLWETQTIGIWEHLCRHLHLGFLILNMIHWKRKQFWIWKNKPLKNFFSGKLSMNLCQSVRLDYTFHTFRILSFTGIKRMGRVVCLNAFLFQILYSKWFKSKMFKNAPKYTKFTIPNTPFKIMIPLYCMYGCILVYRGLVCM